MVTFQSPSIFQVQTCCNVSGKISIFVGIISAHREICEMFDSPGSSYTPHNIDTKNGHILSRCAPFPVSIIWGIYASFGACSAPTSRCGKPENHRLKRAGVLWGSVSFQEGSFMTKSGKNANETNHEKETAERMTHSKI